MSDELRIAAMEACLRVSRDACAIFDAIEADRITLDTARSIVRMGASTNEIHLALQTLVITVITGSPVVG